MVTLTVYFWRQSLGVLGVPTDPCIFCNRQSPMLYDLGRSVCRILHFLFKRPESPPRSRLVKANGENGEGGHVGRNQFNGVIGTRTSLPMGVILFEGGGPSYQVDNYNKFWSVLLEAIRSVSIISQIILDVNE